MTQTFLLGGYTKRENKGLMSMVFDAKTGACHAPQLLAELGNPTYLTLSHDKQYLFAIHKDEPQSGVVAFKRQNGVWQRVADCLNTEIPGCHLCYSDASRTLYVANYHEGAIDVYHFDTQQQLTPIQRVQHTGSSTHPNQASPHVHYVGLNAAQTLLYVCDLGTDTIYHYALAQNGTLDLVHELRLPSGTGPRHFVLHPQLPLAYVIGELNNTTSVIALDANGYGERIVQTMLNVPEAFAQTSAGAAIRMTQDGRFLYTSTRFHNVLTAFEITPESGLLTLIQCIDTHGEIPRDFTLDETEQYVLVPHQDSDHLSVFTRDAQTGRLTFAHSDTVAPECVCIIGND
ncbi:MAG: beta-propeller fold lactonase family protein [Aerococcaceae bacterium]|nr:beta-propeller fold lactonase family protein [Aerococcaceae bacterium]